MIDRILYFESNSTDPHHNLTTEECLLHLTDEHTLVFYLWQNNHTVVIGRNQNCFKECDVAKLEKDGGFLVRRLSGGGAVYHDLGNLNFTFLMSASNYDLDKQLAVIVEAVGLAGIKAEKSGRNDITADGRKFSGNAFYKGKEGWYHHGTILLHSDMEVLPRFLKVSKSKLEAKGVSSVSSRVVNLCRLNQAITVDIMKKNLLEAIQSVYDVKAKTISFADLDQVKHAEYLEKYESPEWKYGKEVNGGFRLCERFPWGELEMIFQLDNGLVRQCFIYSDGMDAEFILSLDGVFDGVPFHAEELEKALSGRQPAGPLVDDVKKMLQGI